MADEIAVDSFLNLLGQSELVSDDQLLALMAEFRGGGVGSKTTTRELASELVRREILTTWQADMLRQRKNRGFHLGPYRILRPLGQGGMSKVFLAEHEMMRRRCAIKVLPSKYEGDADLLNRFHLEAVAVAALDHPNIVRAYDFNKDVRYGKEIHYLVMEYVEGPDLRRMVEEYGPLDCRTAADCIAQAAEGLAHAHAAGFVHRDIKPANLLVDPHGVLKVLDLGLAMFTVDQEQAVSAGEGGQSAVGTADYAAPEQVVDSQNVDGRADIYGLGYTFYFLLTGRRPFSKSTIMELLMAHRVEKHEPISKFRPDVPHELEVIIDKMTAKSPLQRYQTAKEVAEKLRAWLHDSESGRASYSRISALMAEAARAKQSAGDQPAPAASAPTDRKEFELATLDDLPAASSSTIAAKTGGSSVAKGAQAATTPSKEKDRNAVAKSATPPEAKKPAKKLASSPSGRLLPDDLISSLPPPGPRIVGSGSLSHLAFRQPKKQSTLRRLLRSPWSWVGLGGVTVLALLMFLVVQFGFSSPSRPSYPKVSDISEEPDNPPLGSDSRPIPPPQLPSPVPSVPHPPEKASASPSVPAGATPQAPTGPPQPEVGTGKQPPAAPPPTPQSSDVEAIIGRFTQVSFQLKSVDPELAKFYFAVGKEATAVAGSLGLQFVDGAPVVMEVDLKVDDLGAAPKVILSAELKYFVPGGKVLTLWKQSQPIVSVDPIMVTKSQEPEFAKIARKNAAKFFAQFAKDVREARARVKAK